MQYTTSSFRVGQLGNCSRNPAMGFHYASTLPLHEPPRTAAFSAVTASRRAGGRGRGDRPSATHTHSGSLLPGSVSVGAARPSWEPALRLRTEPQPRWERRELLSRAAPPKRRPRRRDDSRSVVPQRGSVRVADLGYDSRRHTHTQTHIHLTGRHLTTRDGRPDCRGREELGLFYTRLDQPGRPVSASSRGPDRPPLPACGGGRRRPSQQLRRGHVTGSGGSPCCPALRRCRPVNEVRLNTSSRPAIIVAVMAGSRSRPSRAGVAQSPVLHHGSVRPPLLRRRSGQPAEHGTYRPALGHMGQLQRWPQCTAPVSYNKEQGPLRCLRCPALSTSEMSRITLPA